MGDDGTAYLSGLLLQHQQLVDRALDIGLIWGEVSIYSTAIDEIGESHLGKGLSFRDQLVGVLGEVLLGLQHASGHDDECEWESRGSVYGRRRKGKREELDNGTTKYQHGDGKYTQNRR